MLPDNEHAVKSLCQSQRCPESSIFAKYSKYISFTDHAFTSIDKEDWPAFLIVPIFDPVSVLVCSSIIFVEMINTHVDRQSWNQSLIPTEAKFTGIGSGDLPIT
jgi:hypothetical protein